MNRTGITSSVAGALILGALVLRSSMASPGPSTPARGAEQKVSARQSRSPGTAKKQSQGAANEYPEDGPWKASRQHYVGTEADDCQAHTVQGGQKPVASLNGVNLLLQQEEHPAKIDNLRKQLWCIPDNQPVQAMIVIAPDPAHTNLSLVFDRTLEAVQLAANSAQYLPDRYWLPWDAAAKTAWADYASLQQATNDQEQTEKQPGLLLYRWNGSLNAKNDAAVLYVFLVGDTPTAGINGEQFLNAVQYIDQICARQGGTVGCVRPDPIYIMGPTFSGSLDSLRQLVQPGDHKFTAYSGTVSIKNPKSTQEPASQPTRLQFRSLVTDTDSAVNAFTGVLENYKDVDCAHPEVAILTETATAYGSWYQSKQINQPKDGRCFTTFIYPREIATLRNAYQAAGVQKPAPAAPSGASQNPYLSLNLADQTNRSDEPPDFSAVQGPLSKEAVLMNYAADMRRNHYKYIGVSATNILDTLFLVSFLRTAVPDARLFVLNSDLLFERDLESAPYVGTLAITSYPLIVRDLDWVGTKLDRLPFADQYEEGQYNAGVLALAGALGSKAEALYECGAPPCQFQKLPLWLTVAGTGGYWPVRKLSGPSVTAQGAQLSGESFSGAWQAVVFSLCALALLQAGILFNVSPLGSRFRDFSLLNPEAGQRLFFIHVASASLTLSIVMLAAPAWRSREAPSLLIVSYVLGLVALASACALLQVNYVLRWKRDRSVKPATADFQYKNVVSSRKRRFALSPGGKVALQVLGSLAVWIMAALLAYTWHELLTDSWQDYGFFFGFRALHLATGVSPFTPLLPLFAAIYLWGLCEVLRLRFNDLVRPRLQTVDGDGKPVAEPDLSKLRPGWARESFIAKAVRAYALRPAYTSCFVIIFGAWFIFFAPQRAFFLFERPAFGYVYEFLFDVVMAMILSSGFRLAQIWTELHRLLLELKASRLRFAFSRLKDHNWSPVWRQGGEEAEWSYMVQSFECLQEIANCEGQDGTLKATRAALSDNVMEIRRAIAKPRVKRLIPRCLQATLEYLGWSKTNIDGELRDIQQKVRGLQNELAKVLATFLDRLQNVWETQCLPPEEVEEEAEDASPVEVHCCEEKRDPEAEQRQRIERYVALRYVAFIRSVLSRIRYLLIFLAASFSLLMISLNVYSFEPHQALLWAVTAVFVVVGGISLVVLTQIHRDYILSRITGTKPNRLNWEFYARIIALGVVPLITLLSTHFPAIGRHLLSFLQPGLDALK